jgi:hypothetical protein
MRRNGGVYVNTKGAGLLDGRGSGLAGMAGTG